MTEANNVEKKVDESARNGDITEQRDNEFEDAERGKKSFRAAIREFFARMQRTGKPVVPPDPKQDRTRALVLLIGGIVGSVLLFVGVFSTPPTRLNQALRDRTQPNLGRKDPAATARLASPTPLLSAQSQSDESGQDRLTAADIQNTSQRDIADGQLAQEGAPTKSSERPDHISSPTVRTPIHIGNQGTVPVTYNYGARKDNASSYGTDESASLSEPFRPVLPGSSNSQSLINTLSPKSSIVFVRSGNGSQAGAGNSQQSSVIVESPSLLPPGSRLIARIESAVTSAVKVPVVADIEYNYEKDGVIVVPAGTKAIGELQQTSTNGYVGIVFHTLQMPDGRSEQIEATAMDLRNEPLKGKVTGTNKGRKFLTRTLTGVGTIGAYVLGAGGSTIGQPISGGTLLRDRLAGNITSAGEQELTNAAFAQNIVVTLPAQTRLYIVFQKAAIEHVPTGPPLMNAGSSGTTMPTAQELRELMDLRREINQMYTESAVPQTFPAP